MSICSECGQEIPIGSWPYCPHGSVYPEYAQSFQPLVVDRDPLTGQISYPGSSTDPVPAGYVRDTLSTIEQVDRFCRARTDEASAERRENIRGEKEFWDQRIHERRQLVDEQMKKLGFKGRGLDRIRRFLDARREAKYDQLLRQDVNVFSDVFSYDASNREPYSDQSTGWRNRKG